MGRKKKKEQEAEVVEAIDIPEVKEIETSAISEITEEATKKEEPKKLEYDFTDHYEQGNTVFYVRFFESVDIEEIKKLKLRSVKPIYMVGTEEKSGTIFIGSDMKHLIFNDQKEAKKCLKALTKGKEIKIKEEDIPLPFTEETEDEEIKKNTDDNENE